MSVKVKDTDKFFGLILMFLIFLLIIYVNLEKDKDYNKKRVSLNLLSSETFFSKVVSKIPYNYKDLVLEDEKISDFYLNSSKRYNLNFSPLLDVLRREGITKVSIVNDNFSIYVYYNEKREDRELLYLFGEIELYSYSDEEILDFLHKIKLNLFKHLTNHFEEFGTNVKIEKGRSVEYLIVCKFFSGSKNSGYGAMYVMNFETKKFVIRILRIGLEDWEKEVIEKLKRY